ITGYGVTSFGSTGMASVGNVQTFGSFLSGVASGPSPSEGDLRLATTNGSNTTRTWEWSARITSPQSGNLVLQDLNLPAPRPQALVVQAVTGNVGIGLPNGTQPTSRLHVAGTALVTGIVTGSS